MSSQKMALDFRLSLDKYEISEQRHIHVDQARCQACESKPCLTVCPASVYKLVQDKIHARYENCLECGTCQISCDSLGKGGITWRYPEGGFGIVYRQG